MSTRRPAANAKTRFSSRVDNYIRYRPGYPPALLNSLRSEFDLRPEHVIADIGSGTGILSELLLKNGNTVFGVEPNDDMRAAAERLLADFPAFRSVGATAEETTLPAVSVDWITAAQAFHWFDVASCRTEFARILRPGGRVALMWNDRLDNSPLARGYSRLIEQYSIDYNQVNHQDVHTDEGIAEILGDRHERRRFDNQQRFDLDGMLGRALSSSYLPGPDHPRYAEMVEALRALFAAHESDGRVVFEYDTLLFVGTVKR